MTSSYKKNVRSGDRPLRIGAFEDMASADEAVVRLLNAGFSRKEIVVVAPTKIRDHFAGVRVMEPSGSKTGKAAIAGGIAGGMLAGLIAAAVVVGTGGGALVIVGPIVTQAAGGVFAGGFIGAMLTRGFEREAAEFYDQALKQGMILVGVDCGEPAPRERLEIGERLLADAGARPLPLVEG